MYVVTGEGAEEDPESHSRDTTGGDEAVHPPGVPTPHLERPATPLRRLSLHPLHTVDQETYLQN